MGCNEQRRGRALQRRLPSSFHRFVHDDDRHGQKMATQRAFDPADRPTLTHSLTHFPHSLNRPLSKAAQNAFEL